MKQKSRHFCSRKYKFSLYNTIDFVLSPTLNFICQNISNEQNDSDSKTSVIMNQQTMSNFRKENISNNFESYLYLFPRFKEDYITYLLSTYIHL